MSVPKEVEIRISRALKGLKISDEKAGKVSLAVNEAAQILQTEIVPRSRGYRNLPGDDNRNKRRDIFDQMDQILKNKMGLKTYPELAQELTGDESLALLVWGGDMISISGNEVVPAKLWLGVLGTTSKFYGFDVITGKAVGLAEVTGEGKLTVTKGSSEPRESFIYDSSPVIKLIK